MFAAASVALLLAGTVSAQSATTTFPEGVTATGTMGVTNPAQPTLGTSINQTSYARLLSMNTIDDFCLFGPPDPNTAIADSESYEVAWCMQARNDARVIPDGTITGVSFIKTDFYVQVMGYGDLTKINIPYGDYGGELDPHGATGAGNPVGGNVTTDVPTGTDVNFAEWMMYVDYELFCFRICTNANSTYSAANMCWHELDEMGCEFVMPGNYNINGTFETCEADVAYPPGWYPVAVDGTSTSFSTFAQYYTGAYTGDDGSTTSYTVGTTVTPSAPYMTPSSSACTTTATISNGIALASLGVSGSVAAVSGASATGSSGAAATGSSGSAVTSASRSSSASTAASSSTGSNSASSLVPSTIFQEGVTLVALLSGVAAIAFFH